LPESPSAEAIITGAARSLDRFQETVSDSRATETNRLVWYVGIAGYVLVNAQAQWKILLARDPTAYDLTWLSVPWVVSAITALLAHLATAERIDREHQQFYAMRVAMDSLLVTENEPKQAVDKLKGILDCSEHLLKYRTATERWQRMALWLQRLALAAVLFAFMWTVFGPSWLR